MKKLIAILALTSSAIALDYDVPIHADQRRCIDPELSTTYRDQRHQAIPTAYSTMLQHYYDSIWSEPVKPQIIIIRERY